MNLPVQYLRMRKSIKSKIIFLIFKKTHGHSKPQVGTKIRKFPPWVHMSIFFEKKQICYWLIVQSI